MLRRPVSDRTFVQSVPGSSRQFPIASSNAMFDYHNRRSEQSRIVFPTLAFLRKTKISQLEMRLIMNTSTSTRRVLALFKGIQGELPHVLFTLPI